MNKRKVGKKSRINNFKTLVFFMITPWGDRSRHFDILTTTK